VDILPTIASAGEALVNPLVNLWFKFVDVVPGIILAIIILIIGYILAYILGHATKVILQRAGVDRQVAKAKITKSVGSINISAVLGETVKWLIFVLFLGEAANQLRLGALSDVIIRFANWLPQVIFAILIILFGLLLAHYVASRMEEHGKVKGVRFGSSLVKGVITFFVVIIALEQIGIDVSILTSSFLIILAGLSLAVGLSFGLGGKKEAGDVLKQVKKYF
jgi:small-conductance mechanosensitive channel